MFQTGIEPAAPRFESWYLSPLGHTAEMLINAVLIIEIGQNECVIHVITALFEMNVILYMMI